MTEAANAILTLASASKTRAKMLRDAGVAFETVPSNTDEDAIKEDYRRAGRSAQDLALALAEEKARAVNRSGLVLGADQVLSFGDETLDKARDIPEAREQLWRLRGKSHELISAAVIVEAGEVVWQHVGRVNMTMRDFSEGFLDDYLTAEADAVLWSVGGYRIEGQGAQLFNGISGDYFSILGLPLLEVLQFLRCRGVLAS